MANTYTLISSVTVGAGGASSIDFTSIPATYTDLVIKASLRDSGSVGTAGIQVRLNGATTNYSVKRLYANALGPDIGSDSSTRSGYLSIGYADSASKTANTFGNLEFYLPNYAGSNYKSTSTDSTPEENGTNVYFAFYAGLWSSTAAVNQVTLYTDGSGFAQYSTAYLYGIKNS